MRRRAKIIGLTISCFFCFMSVNCIWSDDASINQKQPNKIDGLLFVPQRNLIAGAYESLPNPSIRFWSATNGQLKEIIQLKDKYSAKLLSVSSDGQLIVAAFRGSDEMGCYSLKEKKWLWKTKWLEIGTIFDSVQFTPDNSKIVVIGLRNIATHDASTGAILKQQQDSNGFSAGFPTYRTRNKAISPSGRYAAFWQGNLAHDEGPWHSKNIWVVVRDIDKEKTIAKQAKIQEKYKNCSALFTPDEKDLLLGSMDGRVRLWSILDQKVINTWTIHELANKETFEKDPYPYGIDSMALSSDGHYLATFARFGIKIWDYRTKKLLHEFPHVTSSSIDMCSRYSMAFDPESKYFAFENQGQLCLYDTGTWKEKWCIPSI